MILSALVLAPVLWLSPEGKVLVGGKPAPARMTTGARGVETPLGFGVDFEGTKGGVLLPDLPALALADSFTISVWVYPRAYVKAGPGAQILFRGDDRSGLDPYTLTLHSDNTICFQINDTKNGIDQVNAPISLNRWTHVTATFDASGGEQKLYLDGRAVATGATLHQPLMTLSKGDAPGVGIGNVQNDKGPHNQPFDGMIADLRLYDAALKPAEAGYRPLPR